MKDLKPEEKQEVSYPSDKPYGHSILEMAMDNPDMCICGEPLTNTAEHYIHMSQGY
tara:strand:+ start:384 stop:551 length:168 start_codon:yes stop_codon:yes gene_type:complete